MEPRRRADDPGQGPARAVSGGRRDKSATHIWWGEIASEAQAKEIIAWTAWSLLLIGLAPMVALSMSAASGQITLARPFWENREDNWLVLGQAAFLTVESAAAILLITRRTWIAALALLGCCLAGVLALLASIVRLGGDGGLDLAKLSQLAVLELCLLCFTRLVWRAFAATRALPRLALAGNFT